MKKTLFVAATAGILALSGVSASASPVEASAVDIDVYFIAGQSNAVGFSKLSTLDDEYKVEYPNVLFYNGGQGIQNIGDNLSYVRPGLGLQPGDTIEYTGFGPELGMAKVLSNKEKKIAFIKYAYGGTAIYQNDSLNNKDDNHDNWHGPWDGATSGRLYEGFLTTAGNGLNALKKAGYSPAIKGLVWMQGETDGEVQFNTGKYNAADMYEHNLTELFNHFRRELTDISSTNQLDMPIVFGEIYEYSTAVIEVRKIVEAQANVGKLDNNYLINTGDLIIDTTNDGWHWPGNQELELGVRFGEKLYEVNHTVEYQQYSDGYEE
jgi:hypothetical protein